ncbi:MAG: hypothetical protein U9O86_03700 [Campylobacterota bacterium]|nr:hypothetical protein [Campylobacterota bacterium]
MQRENYTIKSQSKNAMAMIMAIMVIVIIGTIMALSMSMTVLTTKRNLDMYLYEQVEILADSAREYAMYKIGNTPCVEDTFTITGQDDFYDIDIDIKYIVPTGCTADPTLNFAPNPDDTDTELIHSAAVLNITVAIDKSKTNTSEDIRFHKRYIENIKP